MQLNELIIAWKELSTADKTIFDRETSNWSYDQKSNMSDWQKIELFIKQNTGNYIHPMITNNVYKRIFQYYSVSTLIEGCDMNESTKDKFYGLYQKIDDYRNSIRGTTEYLGSLALRYFMNEVENEILKTEPNNYNYFQAYHNSEQLHNNEINSC